MVSALQGKMSADITMWRTAFQSVTHMPPPPEVSYLSQFSYLQLVWLVTLVSTLLLNLDLGLITSIAFALLTVIFRTQQ